MKLILQTLGYALIVVVVMGALTLWPAGTIDYWQAWVLLAVYAVATIASLGWGVKNPAVVRRRMHGGPTAETRTVQKFASTALVVVLAAELVASAVDHRQGWSTVPTAVSVGGDILVAFGFAIGMLTVVQNNYAGARITVEDEQPVVAGGLYGMIRHPMYLSVLIIMAGLAPALGSYWGLLLILPGLFTLMVRIRDEEQLLTEELTGYREYTRKVRYRLIPGVW